MKQEEIYHNAQWEAMEARLRMSKHDIQLEAQNQLQQILDAGETDEFKLLAITERNKTFWDTFSTEVRAKINDTPEKSYKAFGCEFAMRNTGDRLDYASDPIYAQIQEQLKEREALLKVAFKSKQPIYDEHGAEVPKVPVKTFGKETLIVKF
jgi:hypothetical protein